MPRPKSSPLTVTGDAREVQNLILNLRAAGAEPGIVTVGGCTVELRQTAPAAGRRAEAQDPRQAIYEQFGGEAYRRMIGAQRREAAVDGADYQPVLEVER